MGAVAEVVDAWWEVGEEEEGEEEEEVRFPDSILKVKEEEGRKSSWQFR